MQKQLKISDISKLLGVSAEGIRKFVKLGVVEVHADPQTNYRTFYPMDVTALLRSRMFRAMGFSLQQTAELINDSDIEDVTQSMRKQEKVLEHEILWNKHLIAHMRGIRNTLERLNENLCLCELSVRPAMYRLALEYDGVFLGNAHVRKTISKWNALSGLIDMSLLYNKDELLAGKNSGKWGVAILEEHTVFLKPEDYRQCDYYPSVPCVHTIVSESGGEFDAHKSLSHLFLYMKEKNIHLSGDIVSRSIMAIHKNKEYRRYRQIWAPYF